MNKCVICGQLCSDEEIVHQECHDKALAESFEPTSETNGMTEKEIDQFYEKQSRDLKKRPLFTNLIPC